MAARIHDSYRERLRQLLNLASPIVRVGQSAVQKQNRRPIAKLRIKDARSVDRDETALGRCGQCRRRRECQPLCIAGAAPLLRPVYRLRTWGAGLCVGRAKRQTATDASRERRESLSPRQLWSVVASSASTNRIGNICHATRLFVRNAEIGTSTEVFGAVAHAADSHSQVEGTAANPS